MMNSDQLYIYVWLEWWLETAYLRVMDAVDFGI
jgi:hypothetical protein